VLHLLLGSKQFKKTVYNLKLETVSTTANIYHLKRRLILGDSNLH